MLDFAANDPILMERVEIRIQVNDSQSLKPKEDQDLIVLNADSDIHIESVSVLMVTKTYPYNLVEITVQKVCHDSQRQLLVIRTDEVISSGDVVTVILLGQVPPREDAKGFFQDDQTIRAYFGDSEAHYFVPSFDNTIDYETSIRARVIYPSHLVAKATGLTIVREDMEFAGQRTADFETELGALGKVSLEMRPADF